MALGHLGQAWLQRYSGLQHRCCFSWYVATFDGYNRAYGSLGAAIGFMVWLWISAVIVLLGGELNAEMEHQTARDTTRGRAKPLGARGAVMADHVGQAQG